MYTININHKDIGLTTYTIYNKQEADEKGIAYKKWQDAEKAVSYTHLTLPPTPYV